MAQCFPGLLQGAVQVEGLGLLGVELDVDSSLNQGPCLGHGLLILFII